MRLNQVSISRQLRALVLSAFSFLFISSSVSVAQVYKYEDEEGNVVYSDTPPVDNQAMEPAELPDIIVQPSVEIPENLSRPDDSEASAINIRILTPENEATIHNGDAAVSVSAETSRSLKTNESATLLVNGSEYSNSSALSWTITELERGEMQLIVQIHDESDAILAASEPVIIFIQRASVGPRPLPRAN